MINIPLFATLMVPILTGAASAIWSPITKISVTAMSLLNLLAYGIVWLVAILVLPQDPGISAAIRTLGWWPCLAYVALSVAVATVWFIAHAEVHVVWIAVGEAGWPLWAGLATLTLAALTRLPVTPPSVGPWDLLWAAMILTGVLGITLSR